MRSAACLGMCVVGSVAGRGVRGTDAKRKVGFFSASLAPAGDAGRVGGELSATTSPDDDGAADDDKEARIEPGFRFWRVIFHQHPIKPTSTVKKQDACDRISEYGHALILEDGA